MPDAIINSLTVFSQLWSNGGHKAEASNRNMSTQGRTLAFVQEGMAQEIGSRSVGQK